MTVVLRGDFGGSPRVREVVTRRELSAREVDERVEVAVPAFEQMAVLAITADV